MAKNVTRPTQHTTDTKGQKLFEKCISDEWTIDQPEMGHDYGRDYFVRVFESGKETRYEFKVQLKSSEKAKVKKGCISYSKLSVSTLKRFLTNDVSPVYLVIADLTEMRCVYMSVQEYAASGKLPKKWKDQKTVTIRIPVTNDLEDTVTFFRNVKCECDRIQSPQTSLKRLRKSLEDKDKRFHVTSLTADESGIFASFAPSRPVRLKLAVPATSKEKLEDLVSRGRKTTFKASDIVVTGSPHFDDLEDGLITFQFSRRAQARLTYFAVDDSENRHSTFQYLGQLEAGQDELRFEGHTEENAYRVRISASPHNRREVTAEQEFIWDLTAYEGQDVRCLPFIEDFDAFLTDIEEFGKIGFELSVSGNRVLGTDGVSSDAAAFLLSLRPEVAFWKTARAVARYYDVDLKYMQRFESADVKAAYSLFMLSGLQTNGNGVTISGSISSQDIVKGSGAADLPKGLSDFKVTTKGEVVRLLGKEITLGTYELTVTEAELAPSREEILRQAKEKAANGRVAISFKGAENSSISVIWLDAKIESMKDA